MWNYPHSKKPPVYAGGKGVFNMDHHYFKLSLVFIKYNPYELGLSAHIEEVETEGIPADRIMFHASALTLCRYFYKRETAEQAEKEARWQMKAGAELDLFSGYIRQIQDSVSVKE
jgi:hypothetical protein